MGAESPFATEITFSDRGIAFLKTRKIEDQVITKAEELFEKNGDGSAFIVPESCRFPEIQRLSHRV